MNDLVVIIPYYNGEPYIERLINSLPTNLPVVIVDDHSDTPLVMNRINTRVIRPDAKGYFTGAVNRGLEATNTDVLILNQDVWFEGEGWLKHLGELRRDYDLIGDPVKGHPAWPGGYVQGTFMYISRRVIDAIGLMNERDYPLWGSTCEYQIRACRKGFKAYMWGDLPYWMEHQDRKRGGYGSAITQALKTEPTRKAQFIRTPPAISVIVPCYNYGRYLDDCINSLIGGPTSLGDHPGQSFQSFEVIIVDDASQDETPQITQRLADDSKGIRVIRLTQNQGTPGAINAGIEAAYGKYITVLSADDMREPDALEALYRVCEANPQAVAYDDMMIFKAGQRVSALKMLDYDFDRMLNKNPMHAGIMYPKAAWVRAGGYPLKMQYGREDWAFNIALGLQGYCGVRVAQPGYLYRRESQNRSLRNQGNQWRERFLMQLQTLYPQVYAGERPAMCCGKDKIVNVSNGSNGGSQLMAAMSSQSLIGAEGMVLIEYTGSNVGTETWQPVPQRRYELGGSRKFGYVDQRDVEWFLQRRDHSGSLFRLAKVPSDPNIAPAEAASVNPVVKTVAAPTKAVATAEAPMVGVKPLSIALDPADYSVRELGKLRLAPHEWELMLEKEQAGQARKSALEFMEKQLG